MRSERAAEVLWLAAERTIRGRLNVTIDQFGSIGEVIGALATVGTLAYLAVQIRANTQMMRAESRHTSASRISEVAMGLAHDRELAGIFRRGLANPDALEPDELVQFTFLLSQFMTVVEMVFDDVKSGLSDPDALERAWGSIRQMTRSPGGRAFWKRQGRISYPPEFCSFVESKLEAGVELDSHGGGEGAPLLALDDEA